MAYTENLGQLFDSPIRNVRMGAIADRPATAELNDVYISTDEDSGKWKIYWYSATGWQQYKGISKT